MSLVDDLNINIEDTPHDEDHLDTTLQDPNDLSINLNEKVQYAFVDEDIANFHTDRFYSIKHHLMSEDYYRTDNEAEDRLLLVSNVDEEFIKRSQLCTDSASTVIISSCLNTRVLSRRFEIMHLINNNMPCGSIVFIILSLEAFIPTSGVILFVML